MTNKCITLLLICLPLWGLAQERSIYLQGAYLGQMISHPGISLGLMTEISPALRVGIKAGAYHHHRMHTGVALSPTLEWLHTRDRGFQFGASLGAGYLRTWIPNTFELAEDGQVKRAPFSGTNHAILVPAVRLGKDLSVSRELPIAWYVQPQIMIQAPYFLGANPLFFLEAGITYQLNKS